MLKHYFNILLFLSIAPIVSIGQEIRIFKVADFDLNGAVKTCTVIQDYGQEIFEFNENGFLTKSTTQYNESDKDIIVYKYEGGELIEKRMESYKDNQLDTATSMVNFYEIDTTGPKYIKEKIISFDKEFFEQQEYYFNDTGILEKVVLSHENAVDEILIERTAYKDEQTETIFENGVIEKSVRNSSKRLTNGKILNIQLIKDFVDGEPDKALEKVTEENNRLVSEQAFSYDFNTKEFAPTEKRIYGYNKEGILSKMTIKTGNTESVKEFIFQFDDSEHKNWVKKITTPDNSYITRRIEYHIAENTVEEKPE
ncbi:hypothetical protein [Croceitalea rosinachiae]|uniref:YD repeat-containing protein n=1 Tax=Croceitalea rosinachiae TaxID=3075596 RepID=A0ABU3AC07_9FLAO|nr:hypothetical protein [Croceitalea sp. F388]MDT0607355.1 hypothetical protein [Croceitalea sp. F388]